MLRASGRIDLADTASCFHVVMERGDPHPELATNAEWREEMKRARTAAKLTQVELGRRVGTSQAMISDLESGNVEASQFVLPICRELEIHPPTWMEDEAERAWLRLGRDLRTRDEALFRRALSMVESMAVRPRPAPHRVVRDLRRRRAGRRPGGRGRARRVHVRARPVRLLGRCRLPVRRVR